MPKNGNYVSGIDVGTSKVATVVGEKHEDGTIHIIGLGRSDARGIRKGIVSNLEEAITSVKASVEDAEQMADSSTDRAYVSINGAHIRGVNSKGVIVITNRDGITSDDVSRVQESARNIQLPPEQEIFHTISQEFIIDDQDAISEPRGLKGNRLEASVHIVVGARTCISSMFTVVNKCGIHVQSPILGLMADAEATLTPDEKEIGVALINFGAGTSGISIFERGAPIFTQILDMGSNYITNDLAVGLRTSTQEAEKIKRRYGCALMDLVSDDESIEVASLTKGRTTLYPRSQIVHIIQPRLEEIFHMLYESVKNAGFEQVINAGVVITGGGAMLEGITDITERIFNCGARIGQPQGIIHITNMSQDPAYSTAIGLILQGFKHFTPDKKARNDGAVRKTIKFIKDIF